MKDERERGLDWLLERPEVLWVEPKLEYSIHNKHAVQIAMTGFAGELQHSTLTFAYHHQM